MRKRNLTAILVVASWANQLNFFLKKKIGQRAKASLELGLCAEHFASVPG